jgi:hypothetical protein
MTEDPGLAARTDATTRDATPRLVVETSSVP